MSDVAIIGDDSGPDSFRPLTAMLLGAVGIVAFIVMMVIGTLAPAESGRESGGANAASVSAIGFSGIVQLADAMGLRPAVVRDDRQLVTRDLVVLTPEHGFVSLDKVLAKRGDDPTLVVLPKWNTEDDPDHRGWVRHKGLLPVSDPEAVLAPGQKLTLRRYRSGGAPLISAADMPANVRFHAPRPLQVITAADLGQDEQGRAFTIVPLITDGRGGVVAGWVSSNLLVVSDPDLLSNLGMADARQAESAIALLRWLNHGETIRFDLTLNGLAQGRSLVRLALVPPFLPMTIALALAALLGLLHGLGRFGPARPRARAVAFGKRALVDNAAAMIRMAGREGRLGARYAQVARERAQAAFGAPMRLRDGALDAYLDQLGHDERFSVLAARAASAQDRLSVLAAARALHNWQEEVKA